MWQERRPWQSATGALVRLVRKLALDVLLVADIELARRTAGPADGLVAPEPPFSAIYQTTAGERVVRRSLVAEVVDDPSAVELPKTQPPLNDIRSDDGYGVREEPVPGTCLGP